jgi:hypothetical protein
MRKISRKLNTPNLEESKMMLQLHISEYSALTTRHTYLITLQYGIISILIIFLTFVYSYRHSIDANIFFWVTFAGIQAFILILNNNIYDINNYIYYIETDLRKMIHSLLTEYEGSSHSINNFDFWKFEYKQSMGRNPIFSRYLEWFMFAIMLMVFCQLAWYLHPIKTGYERLGCGMNLILLFSNFYFGIKIFKVRKIFSEFHKNQIVNSESHQETSLH